jgi:hypothetical protein
MQLREMDDVDIARFVFQVLRYETPVAVMRLLFAAEEAGAGNHIALNGFLDAPALHQLHELDLVAKNPSQGRWFKQSKMMRHPHHRPVST